MILVTGGAGFIGSHLLRRLVADGLPCCAVDDFNDYYDPAVKRANFDALRNRVPLLEADIREAGRVERFAARHRPDTIVHLAARAGVRPSLENPLLYESVNGGGTLALLEIARRLKLKRFVFASSSSVYGASQRIPFTEEDPVMEQASPYGVTKRAGELYCSNYASLYGVPCICLRFFTVYGPGQRPDMAIAKFAKLMLAGKPVPVFGDGTTRRDYTYIDDIVQGVRAACDWKGRFDIVNLGESRTVELGELVGLLEKTLGVKATIERKPLQPGDVPATWADISKARRILGYSPATPIEEGLRRYAEWVRAQPATAVPFASPVLPASDAAVLAECRRMLAEGSDLEGVVKHLRGRGLAKGRAAGVLVDLGCANWEEAIRIVTLSIWRELRLSKPDGGGVLEAIERELKRIHRGAGE